LAPLFGSQTKRHHRAVQTSIEEAEEKQMRQETLNRGEDMSSKQQLKRGRTARKNKTP